MPELLLEVGAEELPASFVRKAYTDLRDILTKALQDAGVLQSEGVAIGTPRRLIISFPDLRERQEDQSKEQRGPSLKAAYGADGQPTGALLGFCRSQGVEASQVRDDGEYIWITKQIPGQPTSELLAEILPKAIRGLTFDKTMRWGQSRMRFARPIRWLLAVFDGQVVPFEIEGVQSGARSRGHRFYAPEEFEATTFALLVSGLRERKVEPYPELRRERIVEEAARVAAGVPQMTDDLVDENVFLTEWPTAIGGEFKVEFQDLPVPVLETVMAKHEKMFPVRDAEGKLLNRFVFVRNSGEDDSVRQGAEWVLNARFNDAKFFFDEDKKHTLAEFLEKTSGILFQEKLGSVRQRATRLSKLCAFVATETGADEAERALAEQAGLYAKADLSTGLVSELSSLQGVIGGEYARREEFPDPACWAIASQYDLSKNPKIDCAGSRTAIRLIIADQIDKLAGFLAQGLAPSGSSDPFALRRACTLLIEAAWLWPGYLPSYDEPLSQALNIYLNQRVKLDFNVAYSAFWEAMASRYEALLPEVRYDLMEAALKSRKGADVAQPRAVRFRLRALERVADDVPTIQTATRPLNIVSAAVKKGIKVEPGTFDSLSGRLQSDDGEQLLMKISAINEPLRKAERAEDDQDAVRLLMNLMPSINAFFESTMVMADDPAVRDARLSLLSFVCDELLVIGDWTKIVIEG